MIVTDARWKLRRDTRAKDLVHRVIYVEITSKPLGADEPLTGTSIKQRREGSLGQSLGIDLQLAEWMKIWQRKYRYEENQ